MWCSMYDFRNGVHKLSWCYKVKEREFNFNGNVVRLVTVENLNEILENLDTKYIIDGGRIPYFAELWPSSIALSQYIISNLDVVGKRVLDLGCGLGLVGIVASLRGAHVVFGDYETDALAFSKKNSLLNYCKNVEFLNIDWRRPPKIEPFDVIFASDIVYEDEEFLYLESFLKECLRGFAIVAEPNRKIAQRFFETLKQNGFSSEKIEDISISYDGYYHTIAIHCVSVR
ncbi:MAG: methyltransferase domain-containing protein [Thermodesulfobacteriota bacterium]|nr:methyltransferase domain-containing protein [Thermodesulfobacteriota bacterium]